MKRADGDPYLHAKLILVKQRERAVCLQGSANLSQAAMLLLDPQGNLELVNLLTGSRDAFDDLLAGLVIEPAVTETHNLNLRYEEPEPSPQLASAWRLAAAAWNGTRLRVEDRGTRPDLTGAVALLGTTAHPITPIRGDERTLEWMPPPAEISRFDQPVAVRIRLADGSESNPVFVCNTVALDAALTVTAEDETLSRIGGLELDDRELETLFGLLDGMLLIDRRSLWQASGKQAPAGDGADEEALHLRYADVDYALLRQHPRVQQYLRGFGAARMGRTRLQVVLSAIASHLLDIIERADQAPPGAGSAAGIPSTELSEEELEAGLEDTLPQRTRSQQQRLQRILKSFIRRYLNGVTSPEFRALVGVEVLAQNYIIFSHILWRLWLKEWVEYEFLVEAFVTTWRSFWGDEGEAGCLDEVSQVTREQIDALLGEHHTTATLLASLYDSSHWSKAWGWQAQRMILRDFWRAFLVRHASSITPEVIEQSWHIFADAYPHETPLPAAIVAELAELAQFDTPGGFLRTLEQQHGFESGSCQFERVEVYREPPGRTVPITCLVIASPSALRNAEEAISLVSEWMRFQRLDYYRIVAPTSHKAERVVLYEVPDQDGLLWDSLAKRETALGRIVPESLQWAESLNELRALAEQVQARLRVPQFAGTQPKVL